ncbi:cortical Rho GTPase activating protein [Scheffersomyces stipitis CBS 6054]|uniref:Cortical Rho GTPase activating protein n=1 Tax=Scheffersomyces stipitis (strain ATCC 58785 / CBS 6054 / NBRC 10063 / NRRL Y-11545) TaxID=322104 RepID=A3GFQ9_PICST|nr:cortical Rho GTPase activating protein [Scheffersomyces stipitis CBS 6054]EAZ63395.2 cortical Rho GTPase activating protein [Scheffersomyces stipitis CBS 6054]
MPEDSAALLDQNNIQEILNSDSSLDILLTRLKQSITTGEEFAKYIKKKAQIEDEHFTQLKKFAMQTKANFKTHQGKLKNDSFSNKLEAIISLDEKLHDVGNPYVKALTVMYDELSSLIATVSRSRKLIKDEAKKKEKDLGDACLAADKAKQKYYHLCDDLEKLKTSDPNKKSFSLKNKSVEQQEDDLSKKVDSADQDYKMKSTASKKLRDEVLVIHRPNNSKKLKNLILEMDIAMNVQLQKYATWEENLIMNSGVTISPIQSNKPSIKALANAIDNEKDLYDYLVRSERSVAPNKTLIPVEYVLHPSLAKNQRISKPFLNTSAPKNNHTNVAAAFNSKSHIIMLALGLGDSGTEAKSPSFYSSLDPASQSNTPELKGPKVLKTQISQPTFGVSIEDVIQYAGQDNVPYVVKKCFETIERYGLDLEGIYRTSGNKAAVQQLKDSIDQNFTNYLLIGSNIDGTNVHDADIVCVASLVKLYFASLPEPLLTNEYHQSFIETVKSLDETFIAKKLHHLVFNLPDGAYFTLRALIFHLNRVAEHQSSNRMTAKSLAIIWGPVILNDNSMNPQDLSYKSKVVEELMLIANEIFDPDE